MGVIEIRIIDVFLFMVVITGKAMLLKNLPEVQALDKPCILMQN